MAARLYLETSFLSYLASEFSRDLLVAARQHTARLWWETRRRGYELLISRLVLDEVGRGDPSAARRRLVLVTGLFLLEVAPEAEALADALNRRGPLPEKAVADALHIAIAAVNDVDYLLTWNCAHLANARMRRAIAEVCAKEGFLVPVICTPDELLEA